MATHATSLLNRCWASLTLRTRALALLLIPLPFVIVGAITLRRAGAEGQLLGAQIAHVWEIRSSLHEVMVLLSDAEASVREFSRHQDRNSLQPYVRSKESLPAAIAHLRKLAENDPKLSVQWREAEALVVREFQSLDAASARTSGKPPVQAAEADQSASRRSILRAKVASIELEQDRLLQIYSHYVERVRYRSLAVLAASAVAGVFFQIVATLWLAGTVSGQIRAIEQNAELFCQGRPPQRLILDSRELHDLGKRLQAAAAVAEGHEREVRDSEERFRTLFRDAPIAYHETDCDGIIRHVNVAECALLGLERDELVGKHVWEIVAPQSRNSVELKVRERLAGTRPATPYECDYECRDHTLVTVEVHENLIRDKDGRVVGIRSALLDVTARKMVDMAGKKVEQYAQELRTKNEELLLALTAAREASATKGRFLAAMSHELRTPLNGIIGLTELMYDGVVGPVSAEHKEYLGDILASSRHLLQLVNEVLDLAKVEAGKMEFRPARVEIRPLLNEVCDVMRILAEKKHISIMIHNADDLQAVITDSARLRQVVYNYVSNAIKFTPEGGVIQLRVAWEGAESFRVEVEDNGPGISQEDLPRLFADFQQLNNASPGTGLGLALTKRIAEGLGGSIGVKSVPGCGSVFYAILPGGRPDTAGETPETHRSNEGASAVFSSIPIRPEIVRSV